MPQNSTAYITSGGINENVEDYWGYIYEEYGDGFLLESQIGISSKVGSASRTILGNNINTRVEQISATSANATTYLNSLDAIPSITSGKSIGIGNKSLFGIEALANYGSVSAKVDVIRTLNTLLNKVASFNSPQGKGESLSPILGVSTISNTSSLESIGNSSKNLVGILTTSSEGIVDTLSETNKEILGLNVDTTLSILSGKGSSNTTPKSIDKGISISQPNIEASTSCLIQPLQTISQVSIPNTFADGIKELVGLSNNSLSNNPTISISSIRTTLGQQSETLLGQVIATGELSGVANLRGIRIVSSVGRVSCQGLGQTNISSTSATSSINALRAFGETHISSLVEVEGITSSVSVEQPEIQGNSEVSLLGFTKQITQNSYLSFGEALIELESGYLTKNVGRVSSFNFDLDSARYEVSITEGEFDTELSLNNYTTSIEQISHQASIENLEEYSGEFISNQYSVVLEDTQAQFSSELNIIQFSTDIVGQSLTTDIRI